MTDQRQYYFSPDNQVSVTHPGGTVVAYEIEYESGTHKRGHWIISHPRVVTSGSDELDFRKEDNALRRYLALRRSQERSKI